MIRSTCNIAGLVVALFLAPLALAQITGGTVTGRVVDPSGAIVAGGRVDLISETQGANTAAVITNATGDYVIPNLASETYTLEVSAPSFKVIRRTGVVITGGDHVGVPPLTLEVGATTEQVTVEAQAALVQTQSAERSTAIESKQIDELPISHANFTNVTPLVPGVQTRGNSAGGTRRGGVSQNNIMMDGVSAMDTGNNGQRTSMSFESIGEVKVPAQGYRAEYGRSNGLQLVNRPFLWDPSKIPLTLASFSEYICSTLGDSLVQVDAVAGFEASRSQILGTSQM